MLGLARGVLSDLDLDGVLERLVESARELSGATYAALGVLNAERTELERFITAGIDDETRETIGELPRGRGVLGELITQPAALRLGDVGAHPHSYGFPAGHPRMRTFLGVPVIVDGRPFGNLYLTEKADGLQFTAEDEETVGLLADFAGVAIDHARRFSGMEARHTDLQRTVEALEATLQIARALGGETDLDSILELVAKRGRALVSARALVIERERDGELVVAAAAGELPPGLVGASVDFEESVARAALRTLGTLRLEEMPNRARFERHGLGQLGVRAEAGLVVPLAFRGAGHGVLIVVDRLAGGPAFTADDQRLLEAFASSAATAVATAVTVDAERRRQRLAAAEQERARWARELHDDTLQNLAAVRLMLVSQLKRVGGAAEPDDPVVSFIEAVGEGVQQLDAELSSLRSLITELRPAALDDLGTEAAIEDLARRAANRGLDVTLAIDLAFEQGRRHARHPGELETAIYRLVQEALTNAGRHGDATQASVEIVEDHHTISVTISDNGRGFDPTARTSGYGLVGMRERAELLHGTVMIVSAPGEGTTVRAVFPQPGSSRQTA